MIQLEITILSSNLDGGNVSKNERFLIYFIKHWNLTKIKCIIE